MDQPITIGLDLAKNVFQVHCVDAEGRIVARRQLRRSQMFGFFARLGPCLVGMEACSGAHHWARELTGLGHEVRLMPPAYVKAYVKRGKTDAADAEAICEAVTRPTMRFVPVKSAERQAGLLDHKARDFLVCQRTQTVNAIRAHLSEFGIVVAKGIHNLDRLLEAARDAPEVARSALDLLVGQLRDLEERIETATSRITAAQKADPLARRLATIPGLGPIASSALASTTPDVAAFRSARDYAAWLGVRSVSRTDRVPARTAPGTFVRRQGKAWTHFRGREPPPAPPPISRRDGADQGAAGAPCVLARYRARPARPDAREETGEDRGRRAGRPHSPHRLGADRPRWRLSSRAGLRTRLLPGSARRLKNGEAQREVMATRRRQNGQRHPVRTGAAQTAGH